VQNKLKKVKKIYFNLVILGSDFFQSQIGSASGVCKSLVVGAKILLGVSLGEDIIFGSDFESGLFIVNISPNLPIVLLCNIIPKERT
jgi:hypothetical protein